MAVSPSSSGEGQRDLAACCLVAAGWVFELAKRCAESPHPNPSPEEEGPRKAKPVRSDPGGLLLFRKGVPHCVKPKFLAQMEHFNGPNPKALARHMGCVVNARLEPSMAVNFRSIGRCYFRYSHCGLDHLEDFGGKPHCSASATNIVGQYPSCFVGVELRLLPCSFDY